MRPLTVSLLLIAFAASLPEATGQALRMRPADQLMVDLFTDHWAGLPDDIDANLINRGIRINALRDIPLGLSNFSFAIGAIFSGHNLYSDHAYVNHDGQFGFFPIEGSFSNNKLSLNYLGVPVEIRYKTRHRSRALKLHAGLTVSRLINAHTKFTGTDPVTGRYIKTKEARLGQIQAHSLSVQFRVAYSRLGIFSGIALSNLFEQDDLSAMQPVSIGLVYMLF